MTLRSVRHWAEAMIAWAFFRVVGMVPLDFASALGGWLGRKVGYRLPVTKRARTNLARVYPELSAAERENIVIAMWDHLGRTGAEFPHLGEFRPGPGQRIEIVGAEHVERPAREGGPCLFVTAHIGNWELCGVSLVQLGCTPLDVFYRSASNAGVEWIYRQGRRAMEVGLIPKGSAGARLALQALNKGGHLGMLVDQKMNDGIAVPFFGIPAMTAPALAVFAMRYSCPVIPVRIIRLGGARFRVVIEPPMTPPVGANRHAAMLEMMTRINLKIEGWIRETPEQWLWLHKRWPD